MLESCVHSKILQNVPEELAKMRRWILWEMITDDPAKKGRKVPTYVDGSRRSGELGSSEDLERMVTLEQAHSILEAKYLSGFSGGIGFCFVAGDNITGIDLDDCFDDRGEPTDLFTEVHDLAWSYTEYSPSGTGAHIIVKGETNSGKSKHLEVYSQGRFFCFTGDVYGSCNPLSEATSGLFEMVHSFINREKTASLSSKTSKKLYLPPKDEDYQIAKEALNHLCAEDYDIWVRMGMALRAKFGDEGFPLWDEWSRTSSKYNEREMASKWRSFRGSGVNFGSIIAMAKEAGFKNQVKSESISPVSIVIAPQAEPIPSEWPEPYEINQKFKPPMLDYSILPSVIGDFIKDQSELIGCDSGCLFVSVLVCLAGAIRDSVVIKVRRNDNGWVERPCLWGAFIGDPSERKTPAMNAAKKPLEKIANDLYQVYEQAMKEYKPKKEEYDAWKRKRNKPDDEIMHCPEEPIRTQIIAGSATIEALQTILQNNEDGILTIHDELSSWFGSMDVYSKGSSSRDRPTWLELYNGGPKTFDYVGRGHIRVKNWSSSLFGGIQPSAIQRIMKDLPDDGLLQRFFVVCSSHGSRIGVDRMPNTSAKTSYYSCVNFCRSLPKETFELSESAHEVKEEFFSWVNSVLLSGAVTDKAQSAIGKYEGLYMRILLVFHVVDCCQRGELSSVRREIAENVSKLMRTYLFPHLMAFYNGVLGGSMDDKAVNIVADYLLAHESESITPRTLTQSCKWWRESDDMHRQRVAELLEAHGWIVPESIVMGKKLPRSWRINPKIYTNYRERMEAERRRIEAAKSAMKECFEKI